MRAVARSPWPALRRAGLALIVAAQAYAPEARAFRCTEAREGGPSLAWDDRQVPLRIVTEDGQELAYNDIEAVILAGLGEWARPACTDVEMLFDGAADDPRAGFDWGAGTGNAPNENIVVFRSGDRGDDGVDDWLHPATALAITTVTFVRTSGRILDADIEVNDGAFEFTSCDPPCIVLHDALNMLTHELGHVLGLDHPLGNMPGADDATMFSSAPPGETQKRDLSEDDIEGVCAIYPVGAPNGECTGAEVRDPPDVVLAESGCQAAGSAAAPAGILALFFAALRRSRAPPRTARKIGA